MHTLFGGGHNGNSGIANILAAGAVINNLASGAVINILAAGAVIHLFQNQGFHE